MFAKRLSLTSLLIIYTSVTLTLMSPDPAHAQASIIKGAHFCGLRHVSTDMFSQYPIHNFDHTAVMTIRTVRIWDRFGNKIIHMPNVDAFPSAFTATLNPRESTLLRTDDIFGNTGQACPCQIRIDWRLSTFPGPSFEPEVKHVITDITPQAHKNSAVLCRVSLLFLP